MEFNLYFYYIYFETLLAAPMTIRYTLRLVDLADKSILTIVTCEALGAPDNGQITYSLPSVTNGEYPVDTVASFTCNDGYYRLGSGSRTCQTTGSWDQTTPTCNG